MIELVPDKSADIINNLQTLLHDLDALDNEDSLVTGRVVPGAIEFKL